MNHTKLHQYYIQSSVGFRHLYNVPTDRGFDISPSKRLNEGLTKVEIFYLRSRLLLRTMKKVIMFVVAFQVQREAQYSITAHS